MSACPHCRVSVAPRVRYCPRCFLAFRWEGGTPEPDLPEVKTGPSLLWIDFRTARMPGMKDGDFSPGSGTSVSQQPLGLGVQVAAGRAFESSVPFLRRRDQCARGTFIAYDPSAIFQVVVRRDKIGEASAQYALSVSPARQSIRMLRVTGGTTKSSATVLLDWQKCPNMGKVGEPIACELRALGATLEARIADHVVARVHEPRLGVGWPGVRIEAEGAPARVVWLGFDVREVSP